MLQPSRTENEYGYRLRNFFTGEVLADRRFETKEEMEKALRNDLDPSEFFGKILGDIIPAE